MASLDIVNGGLLDSRGLVNDDRKSFTLNVNFFSKDPDLKGTLIHELGHVVHHQHPRAEQIWKERVGFSLRDRLSRIVFILVLAAIDAVIISKLIDIFKGISDSEVFPMVVLMLGYLSMPCLLVGIATRITIRLGAPFLSEYAMENSKEDFADTYKCYVFYRDSFFQKAQTNSRLRVKYRLMQEIFDDIKEHTVDTLAGTKLGGVADTKKALLQQKKESIVGVKIKGDKIGQFLNETRDIFGIKKIFLGTRRVLQAL